MRLAKKILLIVDHGHLETPDIRG